MQAREILYTVEVRCKFVGSAYVWSKFHEAESLTAAKNLKNRWKKRGYKARVVEMATTRKVVSR